MVSRSWEPWDAPRHEGGVWGKGLTPTAQATAPPPQGPLHGEGGWVAPKAAVGSPVAP